MEQADRSDEAYAALTTSATPSNGDEQLPGEQLLQSEEKRRRHTGLQRCRERHRGAEMRRDNLSVSPDTSPLQDPSGQRVAQTRKSRRRDGGDCWRR